jgi:ureidoacrylate peracid hydrolase
MENLEYDKELTALLVIDPYNNFISEGGRVVYLCLATISVNNQTAESGH